MTATETMHPQEKILYIIDRYSLLSNLEKFFIDRVSYRAQLTETENKIINQMFVKYSS